MLVVSTFTLPCGHILAIKCQRLKQGAFIFTFDNVVTQCQYSPGTCTHCNSATQTAQGSNASSCEWQVVGGHCLWAINNSSAHKFNSALHARWMQAPMPSAVQDLMYRKTAQLNTVGPIQSLIYTILALWTKHDFFLWSSSNVVGLFVIFVCV